MKLTHCKLSKNHQKNLLELPPDRILRREDELLSLIDTPEVEWSSTIQRYKKLKKIEFKEVI